MTDKAISPLRQRLVEDMTIRRLGPKTQHDYIRHVKSFCGFPKSERVRLSKGPESGRLKLPQPVKV